MKEEEEDTQKYVHNPREEQGEQSTDSTIHTIPELLLDTMQVPS